MNKTKKALITGITGQDGSYLAELLLEKGYEVHGIIRRSSSFNTGRIEHLYQDFHVNDARVFLHYGDLADSSALSRLLEKIQPDEIYNLAAQSHVRVSCLCPGPVNTNFNKTAGGSFNLKGLSSEYVAKYGIDKCLKGKLLIVPGVTVRLGLFLNRFISNKMSLKIVYHIQNKKVRGGKNI